MTECYVDFNGKVMLFCKVMFYNRILHEEHWERMVYFRVLFCQYIYSTWVTSVEEN